MGRTHAFNLLAAILIGVALWFVFNLHPVWWLAWFVPGLLFALALRTEGWASRGLVALAVLIGMASTFGYLRQVMPLPVAVWVLFLLTLLWTFIIGSAARIVKSSDSAWTVLALPVIAVAMDTLLAHLHPDGNWGSLAYTQSDMLHVVQIAAIFGVGGILFLLMLVNSTLAWVLVRGPRLRGSGWICAGTALAVLLTLGYGKARLVHAEGVSGGSQLFGVAAIDDYIDGPAAGKADQVWAQYAAHVRELARGGASLVLLPEKIAVLSKPDAEARKSWLAGLARDNHVWLVAGLGVDDGKERRNEAWWFAPDGRLATNYLKHHMAPPERDFVPGHEFPVNEIASAKYGVAICKDMHYSNFGREFGQRDASVMLVPAWDFDHDAWMAAGMTRLRGVESGFAVLRSARNGLLSISDAWGRVFAEERSAALPGKTLLAGLDISKPSPTIYTRIGDALGWACVVAAGVWLTWSYRRRWTMRSALAEG